MFRSNVLTIAAMAAAVAVIPAAYLSLAPDDARAVSSDRRGSAAAKKKSTAHPEPSEPPQKGPAAQPAAAEPAPPPSEPEVWSDAEIIEALRECVQLLAPISAKVVVAKPMRAGTCGAPAPIQLSRVGGVDISPPALVNCRVAAKLNQWIETKLQPLAEKSIGTSIRTIVAGGYACRPRVGGVDTARLSEHAHANALDIMAFVTADGQTIDVLSHWPAEAVQAPPSSAKTAQPLPPPPPQLQMRES